MTSDQLKSLALRLAMQCRWIIQSCLREEEWQNADDEFYEVILEGLQQVNEEDYADN